MVDRNVRKRFINSVVVNFFNFLTTCTDTIAVNSTYVSKPSVEIHTLVLRSKVGTSTTTMHQITRKNHI